MIALEFAVSITTDNNSGEVLSAYFKIRRGKVHETREFADGAAFADYDKNGYLLGIEMLAPCKINVVDRVAANESADIRQRAKRFVQQAGPRHLIAA